MVKQTHEPLININNTYCFVVTMTPNRPVIHGPLRTPNPRTTYITYTNLQFSWVEEVIYFVWLTKPTNQYKYSIQHVISSKHSHLGSRRGTSEGRRTAEGRRRPTSSARRQGEEKRSGEFDPPAGYTSRRSRVRRPGAGERGTSS